MHKKKKQNFKYIIMYYTDNNYTYIIYKLIKLGKKCILK